MEEYDSLKNNSSRRSFLKIIFGVCNGIIALLVGIPLLGYIISPAMRKVTKEWISINKLDNIPDGKLMSFEYMALEQDGWIKERVKKIVWVLKESEGNVAVYSPKCTHLGCSVSWYEGENTFKCPCHGGMYDKNGDVTGGPPPRSLDRYDYKIENGKLFIREVLAEEIV